MFFSFAKYTFSKKSIICFEYMISGFENMNVSKKVNYLLRKYDFFIQEYDKATPKWDELTFFECAYQVRRGKGARGRGGDLFNRFQT